MIGGSGPSAGLDEAFAEAFPGLVERLSAQGLELGAHLLAIGLRNEILVPATTKVTHDGQNGLITAEMQGIGRGKAYGS